MESHNAKRDLYIDIIKGIGIVSIVAGHSGGYIQVINLSITTFVYMYHLMIFFFVAGFCFKREHARQPYLYIGKRLGSVMPLFAGYSVLFVLIHNPLFSLGFFNEDHHIYSLDEIISSCLNAFVFQHIDVMLGACWFLPVYIIALGFFCILFSYAEKSKYPLALHLAFVVLSGALGVYVQRINMAWHIQTSVLAVPVLYGGYFVKQHWDKLKKFVPEWGWIPAGIILYWIITRPIGFIELSQNEIISPWLFYPVTAVGMYFCMSLGRLIRRFDLPGRLFAYMGRNSYHIMALHFFAFKIVDVVYGKLIHEEVSVICVFPHAFDYLWPIYDVVGIVFPLIFITVINNMIYFIRDRIFTRKEPL